MLCLNMIVRNEMANLERCLGALAPHIDCWVIGDTGSSDGTQAFIKSFFAARDLPGELHSFEFRDFEQARNAALDCAAATALAYDYLLLADADMELVVEDLTFRDRLVAPGYRLIQRTPGLTYWNTRLVRRNSGARYHGVTHEYIDVPGGVQELHGVWYRDHASGSNRVDKFERDIRLLSEGLEREPGNHRYWFYLAQSYQDAGQTRKAADAYAKRAEMGGWDEEAWHARLNEARCLLKLGDEGGFLRQALAAFNQRPQRAETLYDLARFYRGRGMFDASMLFCEAGLDLPRPDQDILFLEDFVYAAGLQEEYSIAANYARDPARKDRGFAACNWLALNRTIPDGTRSLARSNLFFYLQPASATMPSFAAHRIAFTPPDSFHPSNSSVALWQDEIVVAQRAVNVTLTADGRYVTPDGGPERARNFLLRLTRDLDVQSAMEILPPADLPEPAFPWVVGFQDLRLFVQHGELGCCGTTRQFNSEGRYEQILARIDSMSSRLVDCRVLRPESPKHDEKNWMPQVAGDALRFLYLCDPTRLLDEQAKTIGETTPTIAADDFRGGSQAIAFDGGWLALIHQVVWRDERRFYQHRFVGFDAANRLDRVIRPFFVQKQGIEFAAGLAWHPDGHRLLISYGVDDRESWLATIDAEDVRRALASVETLPSASRKVEHHGEVTKARPATTAPAPPPASPLAAPEVTPAPPVESRVPSAEPSGPAASRPTAEVFFELAPFLGAVDSPRDRRTQSRDFDARIDALLDRRPGSTLPQIHCFYEVMSETASHPSLIAATQSMRMAGHPVRVWSYSPQKLDFLVPLGVELGDAAEVVPRAVFGDILAGSEIRYFSDLFRYAALYENGGLWLDTDVVLLRPFPFRGDHFFNLQWRHADRGHFICGNAIYAEQHSRHMRVLYERSLERFFAARGTDFGDIGPKLLSDYIASNDGAALQDRLFSPMFFNSIDWTEIDRFDQPVGDLHEYLHDERVTGIHLWNARTHAAPRNDDRSLIAMLSDPASLMPGLATLADRFATDKNRHTGNAHSYARIYEKLLGSRRFAMRRLMEIGLCRGLAEKNQHETPSVALWQTYFPFCHVTGVDLTDFSRFNNARFTSFVCDQSKRDELRAVAAKLAPGSFDVIIDDGSHASADQQLTLVEFFPLLAEGGWYILEDLDWQPPGEVATEIILTKVLLQELRDFGAVRSLDPFGIGHLASQFTEILFFDSHYELSRARLLGGLVAIRKGPGAAR